MLKRLIPAGFIADCRNNCDLDAFFKKELKNNIISHFIGGLTSALDGLVGNWIKTVRPIK